MQESKHTGKCKMQNVWGRRDGKEGTEDLTEEVAVKWAFKR